MLLKFVFYVAFGALLSSADQLQDYTNFAKSLFQNINGFIGAANYATGPANVNVLLALLAQGSSGETQSQITTALKLSSGQITSISPTFQNVVQGAKIARAIFVTTNTVINGTFRQLGQKQFITLVESVKFTRTTSAAEINGEVSEESGDAININFPPSELNANTKLVVITGLTVQDTWVTPFPKRLTANRPFTGLYGPPTVPTLNNPNGQFKYVNDVTNKVEILALPLSKGLEFWIVLPNKDVQVINNLIQNLPSILIRNDLKLTSVNVSLPIFQVNTLLNLNSFLQSIGVTDAVTPGTADFTKIGTSNLVVSQWLDQGTLAVNEQGLGASSSTTDVAPVAGNAQVQFQVNRPFFYFVMEGNIAISGGRIIDPVGSST